MRKSLDRRAPCIGSESNLSILTSRCSHKERALSTFSPHFELSTDSVLSPSKLPRRNRRVKVPVPPVLVYRLGSRCP